MSAIYRENSTPSESELIAEGFEYHLPLIAQLNGEMLEWSERRLVIRSLQFAQAQERSLDERVKKALDEIAQLNRRAQRSD